MLAVRHLCDVGVSGRVETSTLTDPCADFARKNVCQVVAWPSPSTETLMEENLPPERYESEWQPVTHPIVFFISSLRDDTTARTVNNHGMDVESVTEIRASVRPLCAGDSSFSDLGGGGRGSYP